MKLILSLACLLLNPLFIKSSFAQDAVKTNHLEHRKLIETSKKILILGDSITYGASMKGAGTAAEDADTYPAKLANLLNQTRQ